MKLKVHQIDLHMYYIKEAQIKISWYRKVTGAQRMLKNIALPIAVCMSEGEAGDSALNTDTTTRHPVDAIQHMLVNQRKRSRR